MDIHHFDYEKASVQTATEGGYQLCPYIDDVGQRSKYADLINIYEGPLNDLGENRSAFSINYLQKASTGEFKKIQNAMRSYREHVHAFSKEVMWTSAKQGDIYKKFEAVKGFKYTKRLSPEEKKNDPKEFRCFVSCNAKATNDFSERTVLLYLLNRFPNPEVIKYFAHAGSPISPNAFAVSELLQWIWRSAIRNEQPISLYIPSFRMRELLKNWLGVS